MAALQWLQYNNFVAMVFASPACLFAQVKLPPFLRTGYIEKYGSINKGL